MTEICAGGSGGVAGAVLGRVDGCGGPADTGADLGDVGEDGSFHHFEVLFVLGRGASGNLVKPFAGVRFIDVLEAAEGGEELVVATDAGAWDKAAHGERVDEGVVELLVFEGILGALVSFATDGLGREAHGGGFRFE